MDLDNSSPPTPGGGCFRLLTVATALLSLIIMVTVVA